MVLSAFGATTDSGLRHTELKTRAESQAVSLLRVMEVRTGSKQEPSLHLFSGSRSPTGSFCPEPRGSLQSGPTICLCKKKEEYTGWCARHALLLRTFISHGFLIIRKMTPALKHECHLEDINAHRQMPEQTLGGL